MSHDNPMTIRFVGDEMTLKATLLVCVLIVISKALVSCVTSPKERFQPSMTSMTTSVFFFTRIILCCRTGFLLMKHVDALKSSNVSISIIMDLPYLIVAIRNKVLGLKVNWDHFEHMMHLSPISWTLLKLDVLVSQAFKRWCVTRSGSNCMQ